MIGRLKRRKIENISQRNKLSFIEWQASHLPQSIKESEYSVISFSGGNWFADQLYSLYSFYHNVGNPKNWIIYNDGTYTQAQINALQQIERVTVRNLDLSTARLPLEALQKYPTLNKVEIMARHISDDKMIVADSDIIFYKQFLIHLKSDLKTNYFLVDEGNKYFDKEFLLHYPDIDYPFNFGLLLLHSRFDMESVFTYLQERYNMGILEYWSDQTAFQKLILADSTFKPLHKELFKVGGKDAFKLSHCVDYNEIALRHFVGPVRHKMWQYSWKKVLGI